MPDHKNSQIYTPNDGQEGAESIAPSARITTWTRRVFSSGDPGLSTVFVALGLIWIIFETLNQHFISAQNLTNLAVQTVVIGILAVGETLVLLIAEIDLSLAQVSGMAAAVLASTTVFNKLDPLLAIMLSLLVGLVFGAVQGIWVALLGVPSFVVTLTGWLASLGLLLAIIGSYGTISISSPIILSFTSSFLPVWLSWVAASILIVGYIAAQIRDVALRHEAGLRADSPVALLARAGALGLVTVMVVAVLNAYHGVPWAVVILLSVAAVFAHITKRTPFGRYLYAIGGNAEAARRSGIPVAYVQVATFSLAGLLAAFGGVMAASRLGSASASSGGGNLLLDLIAAAVIGGVSLFGGRGNVYGALVGALVLTSIENGLNLVGAPSSTRFIVESIVLLMAVTGDTLLRRRAAMLRKE